MLKDFLEVFEKHIIDKGDRLITDSYIPADGTYIIVTPNENLEFEITSILEIRYNKKTKELESEDTEVLDKIKEMDYLSMLISMNKPIDKRKIIHSNNYLSFFVKKEKFLTVNDNDKKLDAEAINGYYEILKNPYVKYEKIAKSKKIYKAVEETLGCVDLEKIEKIETWIKENIFTLDIDKTKKDYLKIFFDFGLDSFKIESKRYLMPNIYNKNDYNIELNNKIYGLPDDNMGLNAKKSYLENKTRKEIVSYLIDSDEAMLQKKAFDYLMNFASEGKYNIFFNDKEIKALESGQLPKGEFSGHFFRIQKGTSLDIIYHDTISSYKENLSKNFEFMNVLECADRFTKNVNYKKTKSKKEVQQILNEVLFSKCLVNNYFSDIKNLSINDNNLKLNIMLGRDSIFNWLYKNDISTISGVLNKVSSNAIKNSIQKGYIIKACNQFNLRCAILNYFRGDINMADILSSVKASVRKKINDTDTKVFESDAEYYFAVGQFLNYLLSKSKATSKQQSLINPFINAKNNIIIKDRLRNLYKKYNYDIDIYRKRIKNIYAMILSYELTEKVNQDILIAGYLHSNLIFESKKGEKINE